MIRELAFISSPILMDTSGRGLSHSYLVTPKSVRRSTKLRDRNMNTSCKRRPAILGTK